MSFASLFFTFYFLPVFLVCYLLTPKGWKNACVLLASILFYSWGAPRFVPILLLTSVLDYWASTVMGRESASEKQRKLLVTLSVVVNLGVLLYFKYSNFFVAQLNEILAAYSHQPVSWVAVALPIGISFLTFEKISYIVDVYTKRVQPAPRFSTYLLFLALFPHLIAGPIFRYHDVAAQLLERNLQVRDFTIGIERFVFGLAKKVLIADQMGAVADKIFALREADLSFQFAWLGALTYALQIYYDFSGYSDMAIGLGRMMGFRFLENFDRPYTSQSITEFWRRWHISLSNWMREYLYIPLGGSRGSTLRTYVNLWIVFLLSGLWHGANWTFLFWGFYHGLFLVLDRLFLLKFLRRVPIFCRVALTFLIVMLGWVPFRSVSLRETWSYWGRMFDPTRDAHGPLLAEVLNHRSMAVLVIAVFFTFIAGTRLRARLVTLWAQRENSLFLGTASAATCIGIFYLSALSLVNSHFHPFIYFRF